jgi:uncharacterized protein
MIWALVAGGAAGLVLGYLGAGGTVVGLPIMAYLAGLPPHRALGTNALGVSLAALALLFWRLRRGQIRIREGLLFGVFGLIGDGFGVRLGLAFPGRRLLFLLGILLFFAAGWMFTLSLQPEEGETWRSGPRRDDSEGALRWWAMIPTAVAIGGTAGFFGIGGGFLIVPALVLTGGLDLMEAAAASLIPIVLFSGGISVAYCKGGAVDLGMAGLMLAGGLAGGIIGVRLGERLPKRVTQRIFAGLLVGIGLYMSLR